MTWVRRVVGIKLDVGRRCYWRGEPIDRLAVDATIGQQFLQQRGRVVEKLAATRTLLQVVEQRRITPADFPGVEERRPVDVLRNSRSGSGSMMRRPVKAGLGRSAVFHSGAKARRRASGRERSGLLGRFFSCASLARCWSSRFFFSKSGRCASLNSAPTTPTAREASSTWTVALE